MDAKRTFDLLTLSPQIYASRPILACKQNGQWIEYNVEQYADYTNHLSYAFISMGVGVGDKVASITNNRPEWNFLDMGLSQAGIVHVPIYPTISNEEYEHILSHSEVKVVFVADAHLYERIKPIADKIPQILKVFTFNRVEGAPNWIELYEAGKQVASQNKEKLEEIKKSIDPDDIVSIIYTSGTTGVSKGVMLSHTNFLSNVSVCIDLFPLVAGDKALSFLPLSHVLERMVNYFYQKKGISIFYAENMGTIGDNMLEVKPQIFVAVPRVLEKVYGKIIGKGKDLKGIKKQLFFWAVNLGYRYKEEGNGFFYRIKLGIARKLIFSKWKLALGNQLKFIITGGAALQSRIARVFWAAGVPIFEGYGLTETSPVISVNHAMAPGNLMFGSVGPAVSNVEVKIASDGEITMRGPSLMKGYFKSPEQTAEVIDEEGWFYTGDIGVIEKGKFIVITDRKKEIFKMSNGKYVAPQAIENKLKESFFIEQALVVGENEKFVSALISPNFPFLHDWCSRYKVKFQSNNELVNIPEVICRYQKEINSINANLGEFERIKRFRLVPEQWDAKTGELSPTLKLRRKVLYERYRSMLEMIYKSKANGNGD